MTCTKPTVYAAGVAAAAVSAVVLTLANTNLSPGENGGAQEFAVTGAVALAVAAFLFGWYAPRAERPRRAAVLTSVLGLVAVPAFWSGLPIVLGAAGAVLGARAFDDRSRTVPALAIALGLLACMLGVGVSVYDAVA